MSTTEHVWPKCRFLATLGLLFLLVGCRSREETTEQKVSINYSDGAAFCTGRMRVTRATGRRSRTTRLRTGIWKYYYPNGSLDQEIEYDDEGESIRCRSFMPDGRIESDETHVGDVSTTTLVYEDGTPYRETTVETIKKEIDSDGGRTKQRVIEKYTIRTYDSGGQVLDIERHRYVDGEADGVLTKQDATGTEILRAYYVSGHLYADPRGKNTESPVTPASTNQTATSRNAEQAPDRTNRKGGTI